MHLFRLSPQTLVHCYCLICQQIKAVVSIGVVTGITFAYYYYSIVFIFTFIVEIPYGLRILCVLFFRKNLLIFLFLRLRVTDYTFHTSKYKYTRNSCDASFVIAFYVYTYGYLSVIIWVQRGCTRRSLSR